MSKQQTTHYIRFSNSAEMYSGNMHGCRVRQGGAVLVISLIMLLMLTLIGISSMSTVTLEEKMVGNMRDHNLAFQAAEAGIRDAGIWLQALIALPDDCSAAPCAATMTWKSNTLSALETQTQAWWENDDNAREYGTAGKDMQYVAIDPRYVIEHQSFVRDNLVVGFDPATGRDYYRNTSYGVGGNVTAVKILQDSFVKRFN